LPDLSARLGRLAGRWLLSGLLISLVVWLLDGETLWRELRAVSPLVIVPALALTLVQVVLSAWRWRYTAHRLGLCLPLQLAIQEYYLATFLNQVLPGGVLGDVNRAWRHGASAGQRLTAVHAVAIERLSGQLILVLVVLVSVGGLMQSSRLEPPRILQPGTALPAVAALILLAIALAFALKTGFFRVMLERLAGYFDRLRRDLFLALLCWPAMPVQLATSLLVLASYLGVFLCLAVGAGYLDSMGAAVVVAGLGSVLLLSMVIPLTVAGWGIREGAAAVLWPLAGLPAEQGVALSVGYGALVFVSSLPGLAFVFTGRRRERG